MKELFTDIYRKVAGFFQASAEKENTKDEACNRLKFVLMQDRTNLTPHLLERMRGEMIDLLSKYVEMDKEALELSFEQEGESLALMLSIPVIRAKDEEEIQALIKAEEEAKAAAEKTAAEEAEETTEDDEEPDENLIEENVEEEVCSCGCQDEEDAECTCEEDCGCDENCDCGCQDEEEVECACGEDCDCEPKSEEQKVSRKSKKRRK